MDVIVPGLGDIDDRVGVGGEKPREARIVGGRAAGPLGHAEGAEARALGRLLLEEFGVERVRARIAALDIVDAEPVEHRGDVALVVEREVDARGQRAVAHRRVEQIEAFAGHGAHRQCRVGGARSAPRVLVMVVLASHWSPTRTRLRFWAVKPWRSNSGRATSLASAVRRFAPRACGELRQRVDQRPADALAGEFGIDKEHVDFARRP